MRIGIYGGTFNPPHLGHMTAAQCVADKLKLDLLILIPDSTPPHKELPAYSPDNVQRMEMARIAADNIKTKDTKIIVSDIEQKREGRSYTADTLTELRKIYPDDELWLLMGTDMFLTLDTWFRPDIICKLANIAAFGRKIGDTENFKRQKKLLKHKFDAVVKIIELESPIEISSTELREQLKNHQGQEKLNQSVYGYIILNHLYGTDCDIKRLGLDDLRAASYSMVKSKRLAHIKGTEEESAMLARKWGADENDARKAAILHDCTKFWTLDEHLQFCKKYGIILDDIEKENLPLLHAKTGAGVAKYIFGMSDEICNAINWHTTGKAGMTLLEKIIYIADYAEPSRKYDWCDELRELVLTDLDEAVLYGLNITINHTRKKNNVIHYRSLEAREWLVNKKNNNFRG